MTTTQAQTTPSTPVTINLVQKGSRFYPSTKDDFKLLRKVKVPHDALNVDTMPLFSAVLRNAKNYSLAITQFGFKEDKVLTRLREVWSNQIQIDTKTRYFIIQTEKKNLKRLNKTLEFLTQWYAKYDIGIEVKQRTSKTKITVKMTKTTLKPQER